MQAINNIIGGVGAPASTNRWLVCDKCGAITEHDMATLPPGTCPHCNQQTSFKVMPSQVHAENLAASFRTEKPAVDLTQVPPGLLRPGSTFVPASADAPLVPGPAVPPAPPAPAKRTRKKAEPVVTPATPATEASEPTPVLGGEVDYRALREAAVNKLIQLHNLNEVEIKDIGTGMIFALGFTRWTEHEGARRPVYSFMELTDTPQSFKEELNAARAEDGMISVDVARVTGLTPEIAATAFNGELIASLRNATGPVLVTKGAKVKLGARLSKQGRLIWFVMGVTK
jgi:DNA-directed RNA polymerase subunit RPC12/RpoP